MDCLLYDNGLRHERDNGFFFLRFYDFILIYLKTYVIVFLHYCNYFVEIREVP